MRSHRLRSQRLSLHLATSLGSFALIGGTALTISSAWLITMASVHPPILVLTVAIVMVRFFGIFRSVARYGERVISHEAVFRRLTSMRVALFSRLGNRSSLMARDLNSGDFVKSIVDDVERAQEYQLRITLPARAAFISLLAGIGLAAWIQSQILYLSIPAAVLFLIVIPRIARGHLLALASDVEDRENTYSRALSDSHYGLIEAISYGYDDRIRASLKEREESIFTAEKKLQTSIRSVALLTQFALGAMIIGVSLLMYSIDKSRDLPNVQIAMAIFLPLVAYEGITSWYPNLFISGKLLRAQRSIDHLLRETTQQDLLPVQAPSSATLVLDAMTASWGAPCMKPVSTHVDKGEVLVMRGTSGSGKSTLALALNGFLSYSGSATIGGIEISKINDLSESIVASLQKGHIFNTTLRENLKIAHPSATDAQIIEVLDLVELSDIDLDTLLGVYGRPISGGEAKRLGVARALLSPAPIIILDEPTEHLDQALAIRIEERIRMRCKDRALIVITHEGWLKSTRTVIIERE